MNVSILHWKRLKRAALLVLLLCAVETKNTYAQNNHGYVDLGLPSGTLWATCNVGANAPEEYGDYFAWGETQPKDYYGWSTYQYCNGSNTTLTKYCDNSSYGYNGFTDNLAVLLPMDDAVTANWGMDWRMPTKQEWEELYNNTTCTWTILNGVNGRIFTASNGNTLFLPAAGFRYEASLYYTSTDGDYWSSSLYENYPDGAVLNQFTSSYYSVNYSGNRYYGRSVRAVRSSIQNTPPEGAINGLFSVSDSLQVYFAQGNLQYQANSDTWRFAENQWDFVGTQNPNVGYVGGTVIGSDNSNIAPTYNGWIDLFGWGTSGYNHGAVCYQPWSTSGNSEDYCAYGNSQYNLNDQTGQADWGCNSISNGGNQINQWRTLTQQEWDYVFNTRTTDSGIRYVKANVNNVNGVILFPDNWINFTYLWNSINTSEASYISNIISSSQWNIFEDAGAVFLPAAGYRNGTSVSNLGNYGVYWSASCYDNNNVFVVLFDNGYFGANLNSTRFSGRSIRLVYSPQFVTSYSIEATPNPIEGGFVSGAGTYEEGQTCTLTATANEGYAFINWTENGEEVTTEATYSFTVTGDRALVANFVEEMPNHWIADGTGFEDNMSFTCVVELDGEEQRTTMLEVGAFCGEECRGSQRAAYFASTDRYIFQIIVFGVANDMISFRLYDHELGQEVDLTSPAPVTFTTDGYGTLLNPYVLSFTSTIEHIQPLNYGWNWWSTYVELNGIDGLSQLENSIDSAGMIIKSRCDGYTEYFNINDMTGWFGTLETLGNEQMYKIRTNTACNAVISGEVANPANHPITISNGWNWIGFPCNHSVAVATALASFTPEPDDIIKGRNSYTMYFSDGNDSMWFGTLNSFEPGQGYMYHSHSTENKTLTFETRRSESISANITPKNNHYRPDEANFADNMTLLAVVELDDVELQGENYEVAVFADGKCRGSARLMYVAPLNRYMAFLTIVGDEASELRFSLYDSETGTVVETCQGASLQYGTDATIGSLETPYVIRFRSTTGLDEWANCINIFPNPVNRGEQFSLGLMTTVETWRATSVEIINAMGVVVETRRATSLQTIAAPKVAGVYTLKISVEGKESCYKKLIVR